MSKSAMIHC